MEWTQIVSIILNIILIAIAAFATKQILINQKQLHIATISSCVAGYRLLGGLKKTTNDNVVLGKYIDLTNEELFYFQHDYLPLEVSKEWIDGMIDFMPITNAESEIINKEYCLKYFVDYRDEMFKSYPRIKHAFELESGRSYDIDLIYNDHKLKRKLRINERKVLIEEILKNIKSFDGYN